MCITHYTNILRQFKYFFRCLLFSCGGFPLHLRECFLQTIRRFLAGSRFDDSPQTGSASLTSIWQHARNILSSDDPLSVLAAVANFIGGSVYPFPLQAQYPSIGIVQKPLGGSESVQQPNPEDAYTPETLEAVEAFLPAGLLDRLEMDIPALLHLSRVLAPSIKRATKSFQECL